MIIGFHMINNPFLETMTRKAASIATGTEGGGAMSEDQQRASIAALRRQPLRVRRQRRCMSARSAT